MILDSSFSLSNCAAAPHRILMKLYRIIHKNLNYHIKQILWSGNKNIYFLFASEIYHGSILLKIETKSEKSVFALLFLSFACKLTFRLMTRTYSNGMRREKKHHLSIHMLALITGTRHLLPAPLLLCLSNIKI